MWPEQGSKEMEQGLLVPVMSKQIDFDRNEYPQGIGFSKETINACNCLRRSALKGDIFSETHLR